jgi:hypothetical protein
MEGKAETGTRTISYLLRGQPLLVRWKVQAIPLDIAAWVDRRAAELSFEI